MNALYDVFAFGLRYWFLLLIILIFVALVWVSVSEYKQRKYVMNEIGTYVGYMEIVDGPEEILGQRIGLMNDNSIGRSKRSDISINDRSVQKTHALIYLRGGHMFLSPMQNSATQINGRRATRVHEIYTGDTVTFGDITGTVYIKGAVRENGD